MEWGRECGWGIIETEGGGTDYLHQMLLPSASSLHSLFSSLDLNQIRAGTDVRRPTASWGVYREVKENCFPVPLPSLSIPHPKGCKLSLFWSSWLSAPILCRELMKYEIDVHACLSQCNLMHNLFWSKTRYWTIRCHSVYGKNLYLYVGTVGIIFNTVHFLLQVNAKFAPEGWE